jgi:hypothetical protein
MRPFPLSRTKTIALIVILRYRLADWPESDHRYWTSVVWKGLRASQPTNLPEAPGGSEAPEAPGGMHGPNVEKEKTPFGRCGISSIRKI